MYKKLGEKIIHARREKGLTQEDLAWDSRCDRTYLARIERGRANPSIRVLWRIARELEINLAILLTGL
jgi:transcriptional regulator with XRE-family HTH domain